MARETREERAVRAMQSQLTEQMIELKALGNSPSKESDVESWCMAMFKSVLGFSASAGYLVRTQETRGKMRFDLVVAKADRPDQIVLVAEIKKLDADLNKSDFRSGKIQLMEYLKTMGDVRWGVLTNGHEWRLYDFKNDMVSIATTDLRTEEKAIDTSTKGVQETAWSMLDFSSYYFEKKVWEDMAAEALALSPDSLARAILSVDIVKRIGKVLNGEHDYKASVDLLTDKLADLLEMGLNETSSSWNDTAKAELEGYIRKQKKAAKRTRKRDTGASEAAAPAETATVQGSQPEGAAPAVAASEEKKAA